MVPMHHKRTWVDVRRVQEDSGVPNTTCPPMIRVHAQLDRIALQPVRSSIHVLRERIDPSSLVHNHPIVVSVRLAMHVQQAAVLRSHVHLAHTVRRAVVNRAHARQAIGVERMYWIQIGLHHLYHVVLDIIAQSIVVWRSSARHPTTVQP